MIDLRFCPSYKLSIACVAGLAWGRALYMWCWKVVYFIYMSLKCDRFIVTCQDKLLFFIASSSILVILSSVLETKIILAIKTIPKYLRLFYSWVFILVLNESVSSRLLCSSLTNVFTHTIQPFFSGAPFGAFLGERGGFFLSCAPWKLSRQARHLEHAGIKTCQHKYKLTQSLCLSLSSSHLHRSARARAHTHTHICISICKNIMNLWS